MSKRVHLGSGLDFATIASAKAHFDPIRSNSPLDVDVAASHYVELKALYEEYCRKTDYSVTSPVISFYPTMEKRNGGYTRCLGVRFQDGSKTTFSLDKALSAVASSK
ncbi:MAG: hypothetical protein ABIL01_24815 [Pseudomonadota bacterium]